MDYKDYITSSQWKVRSRLYRNAHPSCELCGCGDKFKLQTHHISYANIGNEKDEDLMTVCRDCHEKLELIKDYNPNEPILPLYTLIWGLHLLTPDDFSSLGHYSQFYNMIRERYMQLYCMPRYDQSLKDMPQYANVESEIDEYIKEFKREGVVAYEGELRTPEIELDYVDYPYWSEDWGDNVHAMAVRVCCGINGDDNRVTYLKESCDDLSDIYFVLEFDNLSHREKLFIIHTLRAYCVEVNRCYRDKYPKLARNARIVAWVLHKRDDFEC